MSSTARKRLYAEIRQRIQQLIDLGPDTPEAGRLLGVLFVLGNAEEESTPNPNRNVLGFRLRGSQSR